MARVLLVEDDHALNRGISLSLKKAGYEIFSAFTVGEAEECLLRERPDIIICDITLPDGNGLDFGKRVRKEGDAYLIYLTALDTEIDMINGYETGADDYITKPFSLMVLLSKVGALARRLGKEDGGGEVLVCGEIEVNCREMKVYEAGREIALSKKELQILVYLLENAGHILSKEKILEHVWDVDGQFVDDNTVTVNISRLKNKLGTDEISNVRGLGYIWTGNVEKV